MDIKISGRYRHYKGKEYTVLAVAHHSETGERLVIYQAEYDTEDLGPRPVFARPLSMWIEMVENNGVKQSRFKRIDWQSVILIL